MTRAANNGGRRLTREDSADALSGYQLALGRIYFEGRIVPHNDYLAWLWLSLGDSNVMGESSLEAMEEAQAQSDMREQAAAHLAPADFERARGWIRRWHGRYDPSAE